MKPKILIIIGPTASGKSDLAVQIAISNNGEIISADSRQVYKELNIGSGKISKSEMLGINHYGLDIVQAMDKFTANDWLLYTKEKIEEILRKNKLPIIVGGTGMYIDALIYGIDQKPGPNYELRNALSDKNLEYIQNIIINKCKENNSTYYDSLNNSEKNNRERLIRKVEILEYEISAHEKNKDSGRIIKDEDYDFEFIILNPDIKVLEEKIKLRLEKRLLNLKLENEIREIQNKYAISGSKEKINTWLIDLGLEYKYMTKYISGEIEYEEMKKEIINKSIQYAKRQNTWNKKYIKRFEY